MRSNKKINDTIRAAYITGIASIVAVLIGPIIASLFKDEEKESLQKPIKIYGVNKTDITTKQYIEYGAGNNHIKTSPKIIQSRERKLNKNVVITPPDETKINQPRKDSTVNKLNNQQVVFENKFSTNDTQQYGIIETDNDASVAFYVDPTNNLQPKGYIPSGSKVVILRVSLDKTMTQILLNNRSGWVPSEKITNTK